TPITLRLPIAALKPRYGGFNREQLYFDWESPQGETCSVGFSAADAQRLMSGVQPELARPYQEARHAQTKRKRRSNFGLGLVILYVLLPFLLLMVLLWKSHQISAWVASYISLEQEQKLGSMSFAEETSDLKLRQTGYDYEVLKSIGERLTQGSAYHYQWYIAEDEEVNAFALPGGYVVANTGLFKSADSAEEVAGVLAHEVQHVEQRHTLENLVYNLGWQASVALLMGDVSSLVVTQAAAQLGDLKFSRELESEADLKGLESLHKAGIAPEGLITFFDKLAKEEEDSGSIPIFLSTHPASDKRRNTLEEVVKKQGSWTTTPLNYDWKAVQAAAARP
ncbi:MAG TPA: M48 family metallopeptidase, partial [Thiolinea sp.]|nr:M48 family metallopeptidase [Thiolinea sp.]